MLVYHGPLRSHRTWELRQYTWLMVDSRVDALPLRVRYQKQRMAGSSVFKSKLVASKKSNIFWHALSVIPINMVHLKTTYFCKGKSPEPSISMTLCASRSFSRVYNIRNHHLMFEPPPIDFSAKTTKKKKHASHLRRHVAFVDHPRFLAPRYVRISFHKVTLPETNSSHMYGEYLVSATVYHVARHV